MNWRLLADYFGDDAVPFIAQEFRPAGGWFTYRMRKRPTQSWLRKLRREGVTHVSLATIAQPHRRADFSVRELLGASR